MHFTKSNTRLYSFLLLTIALLNPSSHGQSDTSQKQQPNVIVIFTDDWGYGDLGAFGTLDDVLTPHLDSLAKQGVLFTDAYITAPQCSPSRAGLMTALARS